MATLFGEKRLRIGEGFRLTLPTEFLGAFPQQRLVMALCDQPPHPWLIYPMPLWEQLVLHLARQGRPGSKRKIVRAVQCPIGQQGRLTVPPLLRRHLPPDMTGSFAAVMLAQGQHAELWREADYEATQDAAREWCPLPEALRTRYEPVGRPVEAW